MLKNTVCTLSGLALAAVVLAAAAPAQDEVLSHFYGSGVHNYYERDYFEAKAQLSAAIDGGSQDPRAYYYRALANMRTGDSAAAEYDLLRGAELESADLNGRYAVGKALERVQGAERKKLERYRAMVRAQARQRELARDNARYEQRRRAETEILRNVPLGPPPAPLQPPVAAPAAPASPLPPGGSTPFDAPAARPAAEAPADADSPFEEAPAPEEMPADDSTFEDALPDAEPAPAASGDPFGDEP